MTASADDPRTPQDMQETSEEESVSSAVDSEALTGNDSGALHNIASCERRLKCCVFLTT